MITGSLGLKQQPQLASRQFLSFTEAKPVTVPACAIALSLNHYTVEDLRPNDSTASTLAFGICFRYTATLTPTII